MGHFLRGFLSGLLAGFVANMVGFVSYNILNLTQLRFLDFAAVFILGRRSANLGELLLALGAQLFFSSLVGVLFSWVVSRSSRDNLTLKAIAYSLTVWFSTYALSVLFKVSPLQGVDLSTAVSNLVTALIYGLVLYFAYEYLGKRYPYEKA